MKLNGKVIDPLQLAVELQAAGLTVPALTQQGDDLMTYTLQGQIVDLPPAAQPVIDAHVPTAILDAQQLRQQIVNQAQSAAGVSLDALTATQRNALVAVLLWKAGGVTPQMTVRALGQWAG